jgi:hypothetical protein
LLADSKHRLIPTHPPAASSGKDQERHAVIHCRRAYAKKDRPKPVCSRVACLRSYGEDEADADADADDAIDGAALDDVFTTVVLTPKPNQWATAKP